VLYQAVAVRRRLEQARPDIVYVGLGFPKRERLITALPPSLPAAWFVGCGAAIPFAAGALISEPRRLFRRYLVDDLPFAARLIVTSAAARLRP
jgi:N-acetylglucosaminyldiphosphoundecaprenol N-acetyl-beta-D-mannosaminyltransferase